VRIAETEVKVQTEIGVGSEPTEGDNGGNGAIIDTLGIQICVPNVSFDEAKL